MGASTKNEILFAPNMKIKLYTTKLVKFIYMHIYPSFIFEIAYYLGLAFRYVLCRHCYM